MPSQRRDALPVVSAALLTRLPQNMNVLMVSFSHSTSASRFVIRPPHTQTPYETKPLESDGATGGHGQLVRHKDTFLSATSHELRTPLHAIMG